MLYPYVKQVRGFNILTQILWVQRFNAALLSLRAKINQLINFR